jgi:hypothetical protein
MRIPFPSCPAILAWTRQSGDVAPRTSLTEALWVQHFVLMSNINGSERVRLRWKVPGWRDILFRQNLDRDPRRYAALVVRPCVRSGSPAGIIVS